jgi:3-oxoacyl-[acyl-carrier-protein] synthase II
LIEYVEKAKKRVVITGAGLVTPAGQTLGENWTKMVNGETAIEKVDTFDLSPFPAKLGGLIKGFDPNRYIRNKKNIRFLTKDVQYCLAGVRLACEDSGLDFEVFDPSQIGLYVGGGESEVRYDRFFRALSSSLNEDGSLNYKKFGAIGLRAIYPAFLLMDLLNNGFCYSSIEHGLMGIGNNFSCGASAGSAIGEAFKAVQRAEADIVIAGGYDSLVSCFENYFLQSATGMVTKEENPNKAMKPYSASRDGFVPGEGAAFVVLEQLDNAIKRNAPIRGEILGYSCNCDTNGDVLAPDPQGEGLLYAMKAALDDAGTSPSRIDYINSEGNATLINDAAESRAFKKFFGNRCYDIPVSTVKPIIGYPGAASSAIDFVVTLLALEKGTIPPTINYTGGDPECDLDYVPASCRMKEIEYAISVNKGAGGQNCVFVLRHFVRP